jgi:sortase A
MADLTKLQAPLERVRSYSTSRIYVAIELAAWLGGIALMGLYIGERAWSARASNEGIEAMKAARAEQAAPTASHAVRGLTIRQPDTTTWSPKRLADYRITLQNSALPEAVLRVPRLELEVPVYDGTSDLVLNRGAGRIENTSDIVSGQGNVGLAAHRDGFFRPLKDIVVDDTLFIDTIDDTREYRVTRVHIVDPSEVSVLAPTAKPTITLVTCYPFYHVGAAPLRLIVRAERQSDPSPSRGTSRAKVVDTGNGNNTQRR